MTLPSVTPFRTGSPVGPSGRNESGADLGLTERLAFGAVGAGLLLLGLRSAPALRFGLGLGGAGLGYLALRGRNPLATALKINAQDGEIVVRQAVTVGRPAQHLYELWRDLERLPERMSHLKTVELLHGDTTLWTAHGPLAPVQWEATLTADEPGRRIAWRSVPGSGMQNEGEVLFRQAPGDRGTEVVVRLSYRPPAGSTGALFARLRGQEPSQQLADDLARFKRLQELGFLPTTEGQSSGRSRGSSPGSGAENRRQP